MELTVISDAVPLATNRPKFPLSAADEKTAYDGSDVSGYFEHYGDGSNEAPCASGALTGYETLDAPPHYDFYGNTEVLGRRRRFRPSLYELHRSPEVRNFSFLSVINQNTRTGGNEQHI